MKRNIVKFVCILMVVLTVVSIGVKVVYADSEPSRTISIKAKAYVLTDFSGSTVIAKNNENRRLPIASMVKIMTLNLIFDAVDEGKLSLDDEIQVSEYAASMGGSQAFLGAGLTYRAEELIKSIIVASANDSCVAMAEHIAGSVETFVALMNKRAKELDMQDTNFVNCTGLPAPNEFSSAADVVKMSRQLFMHDKFFDYSGVWMYDFSHPDGRVTSLTNTNKLSRFYKGCDGGKTGYTSEAQSCLSATAKRDDTRLICVVIGAPSSKERNAEVTKLLNYGFSNYENRKIFSFGDVDDIEIGICGGKKEVVKVRAAQELFDFVKKGENPSVIEIKVVGEKINAPVKEGNRVGVVEIYKDGSLYKDVDLLACESVEKSDFMDTLREISKKW